jgi:hypothetical protein
MADKPRQRSASGGSGGTHASNNINVGGGQFNNDMSGGGGPSPSPIPSSNPLQQQPTVKIGHYVLGETLGVGTFGKVKSK